MAIAIGQITITQVRDGSYYEDRYAASPSLTVAPTEGWTTEIPAPQQGYYVYKRTRIVHADGTYEEWSTPLRITGDPGVQGPSGNPGALGVNIVGSTIIVSGFDSEGQFGFPTGIVYVGSSRYLLNEAAYTVSASGQGYILASASGAIHFARLVAETEGSASTSRMVWKDFNSGIEITGDAVIGNFRVDALVITAVEMTAPLSLGQFIRSHFMEILRSSDASDQELQDMAMAMGADRIFQTIVAIDAFIKSLWVSRLESEIYSTDANGYPDVGFHLDGIAGVAKIASLMAKNADIVGTFSSDGFRTLSQVAGTTVGAYTVPSTIYKYSEMCDLIPDADERQSLSGTIEGYVFTKATRRVNKRVKLHSNGSYSSTITAAGGDKDPTIMSRITPIRLFGENFYVQWHINYDGNFCNRRLWRTKPGQTGDQIKADSDYQEDANPDPDETLWIKPEVTAGELWSAGGGGGDYVGSYSITPANDRVDITLWVYSGALWGSVTATSNYLHIWTNQVFNSLVLTNGDTSFQVVPFQPDAYYLSSSKAFTVGSTNQDSASMKKYKSGTDFYDRFSAVPVGTNSACSGVIRVNGTSYTVTRLRKDEDRLVFFTGTQEVHVRKFVNATDTGVYTDLAITTAVVLGAMDGGIESMWIVPWAHALYDIGQSAKRFRSLYLSGELISGSVSTGTIGASSVNATTVYGARFN
jgi:hypothetical protein